MENKIILDYAEYEQMEKELNRLKELEEANTIGVTVEYKQMLNWKQKYTLDIGSNINEEIKKIFEAECSDINQKLNQLASIRKELIQLSGINRISAFFGWNKIVEKINFIMKQI